MAKVIATSADGTQVQIAPTWGWCWKKLMKTKYKISFWIGVIILVLGVGGLVAWMISIPVLASANWLMFVVAAIGMFLIFAKPSQALVDNEVWVDKKTYEAEANSGVDVNEKYFTRFWSLS